MDSLDCEAALILGELFSILVDSCSPEDFSVFLGLPHFVITIATKIKLRLQLLQAELFRSFLCLSARRYQPPELALLTT